MNSDVYRLKDLYCAAWIYSQGQNFIKVEREAGICWFIFADKKACNTLAESYWTNNANGKIKAFTEAVRSLKDLIFANT